MDDTVATRLQPAFRPEDLLPVSAFRAYCKERDVPLDDFQLEYYEQVRLLVPAVRIRLGIARSWQTPHGFHYLPVGYHYGSADWMAPFERRGDLRWPARDPFTPWAELRPPMDDLVAPPTRMHETFYDRSQLFAAERLQKTFGMHVRAEGYLAKPAAQREWSVVGTTLARWFAGQPDANLRASLASLGRILDIYLAARDLVRSGATEREEIWRKFKARRGRGQGIREAVRKSRARLAQEALDLLVRHGMNQADVERWRTHFAAQSHLRDRGVFAWVKQRREDGTDDDSRLGDRTRLALAYFDVAEWLKYFLGFLGANPSPTEAVFGSTPRVPIETFWKKWEQPVLHPPRIPRRRAARRRISDRPASPRSGTAPAAPTSTDAVPGLPANDAPGRGGDIPAPTPGANVWQREGDVWLIRFNGNELRVRHSTGMTYLGYLLRRAGEDCVVAQMVQAVRGASVPPSSAAHLAMSDDQLAGEGLLVDRDEALPVLDAVAVRKYRARVAEIEGQLSAGQGGAEAIEELKRERDALILQLKEEGARRRRGAGDRTERARKAVWAVVERARKVIQVRSPALGAHLKTALLTGRRCAYRPLQPVDWAVNY